MHSYIRFFLSLAAIIITVLIVYFSITPAYLLHISIQPHFTNGVKLFRDNIDIYHDSKEPVYFDVDGSIENQSVSKVMFSIHPTHGSDWYLQNNGWDVSKGIFLGSVQLGSPEWPLSQDEQYSFKMTTPTGELLSQGDMLAHVRPISTTMPLVIIALGILASLLQIISFTFDKKLRQG